MIQLYQKTYTTKNVFLEDERIVNSMMRMPAMNALPVLELACGEGHFTLVIKQLFLKVIGVDIDKEMISSNKHLDKSYVSDFVQLPKELLFRKFISAFNIFGVYGDKEKVRAMLQQLNDLVFPSGQILIVAFGKGRTDSSFALEFLKKWGEYHSFTVKELAELAEEVGFKVMECYPLSSTVLKWLEFLPMWMLKPISDWYHAAKIGETETKFLRSHYVVLRAMRMP